MSLLLYILHDVLAKISLFFDQLTADHFLLYFRVTPWDVAKMPFIMLLPLSRFSVLMQVMDISEYAIFELHLFEVVILQALSYEFAILLCVPAVMVTF
jgi:hypothetical protein